MAGLRTGILGQRRGNTRERMGQSSAQITTRTKRCAGPPTPSFQANGLSAAVKLLDFPHCGARFAASARRGSRLAEGRPELGDRPESALARLLSGPADQRIDPHERRMIGHHQGGQQSVVHQREGHP
jgi:hypothetical protein